MRNVCLLLFFLLSNLFSSAQVKYVTETGAGLKNGSSWADAWGEQEFGDNLYLQPAGTQLWIAKGIYTPTKNETGGAPTNGSGTFAVPKGVKLYGGFSGSETGINDRIASNIHGLNKTVLSGDIGTIGFQGDNLFVVVTMKKCSDGETLDGFSVSFGQNLGVTILFDAPVTEIPVINNCIISDNFPSGYVVAGLTVSGSANSANAELKIQNCYFSGNRTQVGGALRVTSCKLTLSNSVFYNNFYINPSTFMEASTCIYIFGKGARISNCTFFSNSGQYANPNAAAVFMQGLTDSIHIQNTTFWENKFNGQTRNIIVSGSNLVSVRYSLFQTQATGTPPASQSDNISANPFFVSETDIDGPDNILGTADDGLSISASSPAIDKGKNEYILPDIIADFAGDRRVKGCRVDIGAYENQSAIYQADGLYSGELETCTQYPVGNINTTYVDTVSCRAITSIVPNGTAPINGLVNVCVKNDPMVQFVNGRPYVQRHYDIIPSVNAANATAKITLYFTQQDFNNYNAVANANNLLPTGPADASGISNIRVEQNHGISLTGVPGTYSGTTVFIDPLDNDITWNTANQIWEVSFDVTGFSGFFITSNFSVLPVKIESFNGFVQKKTIRLQWITSSEINSDFFIVEKITDGANFNSIGRVNTSGIQNISNYHLDDPSPYDGINYYRLKMVDKDGSFRYSDIIGVNFKSIEKQLFVIAPNPAKTSVVLTFKGNFTGQLSVTPYDITGKKYGSLFQGKIAGMNEKVLLDISSLKKGVYMLEVKLNNLVFRERLVVL